MLMFYKGFIVVAVYPGSLYVNATISVVFTFGVAAAELALGGVAVAEAGCAAELVVGVDEEVTGLASVATLAFDVLLAVAVAGGVVAGGAAGVVAGGVVAGAGTGTGVTPPCVGCSAAPGCGFSSLPEGDITITSTVVVLLPPVP